MPRKRQKKEIQCRYFRWLIGERNGVYFADGRSNSPNLGRHSLGTKKSVEVNNLLHQLDLTMAVKHSLADRKLLETEQSQLLELSQGRSIYEEFLARPLISGGPRPATKKRYRAVLDKFFIFVESHNIKYWNQVTVKTLNGYATWLEKQGYAYRSQYLELTLIKQVIKYLILNDYLPDGCKIVFSMSKHNESDTYCWTREQVQEMIKLTEIKNLGWVRNVIVGLANTGLRIGELIQLEWNDLQKSPGFITIVDESRRNQTNSRSQKTTNTGKSRSLPINPELQSLFDKISMPRKGIVFRGSKGGMIKPDVLRNVFVREIVTPLSEKYPSSKTETGFKDGRLHSFRHYFCSVCANNNMPERVLKNWLGHSSSDMVKRYYHLHDDESQRKMNQLSFT